MTTCTTDLVYETQKKVEDFINHLDWAVERGCHTPSSPAPITLGEGMGSYEEERRKEKREKWAAIQELRIAAFERAWTKERVMHLLYFAGASASAMVLGFLAGMIYGPLSSLLGLMSIAIFGTGIAYAVYIHRVYFN